MRSYASCRTMQRENSFILIPSQILSKIVNIYFILFFPTIHIRNIIDVAAMDSHNLQPQEMNNRIKIYSQKMAQQWSSIQETANAPSGLLKDVPNPEALLASTAISQDDLQMVLNHKLDICFVHNA